MNSHIYLSFFRSTNMVGSKASGHDNDPAGSRHTANAPATRAEYDSFVGHFSV